MIGVWDMPGPRENNKIHPSKSSDSLVPAVEQAAKILLFFTRNNVAHANLTEICSAVGISKGRGHAVLKPLAAYGLIERDESTKRYSLGPALIPLSRSLLKHLDIRNTALPHLEKVAIETGCTTLVGMISGDYLIVVAKRDGQTPLGITIDLGHRFPLTAGAHGKAIVAFLPQEERSRILKRTNLYFYGRPERYQKARLVKELEACRARGYALDMGNLQPGIHAAATPIFRVGNRVMGAVIAVGTFPHEKAQEIGEKVREIAQAISRSMGGEI